jgi:hypothetical protein
MFLNCGIYRWPRVEQGLADVAPLPKMIEASESEGRRGDFRADSR